MEKKGQRDKFLKFEDVKVFQSREAPSMWRRSTCKEETKKKLLEKCKEYNSVSPMYP